MLAGTSRTADEIVGSMPPDELPGGVAVHRREGGRERRHGGRGARLLPRHPRARRQRLHGAEQQHLVDREHGRRQRADPPRARDEQRARRARSVQPRERHDRPGVRAALAEPPGRLRAGRHLHGLPGQQLRLQQHHLRRERGGEPLGALPRPARASGQGERRRDLRHAGATSGRRVCGARGRRRSSRCSRAYDPFLERSCVSTRSWRASSARSVSTESEDLADWIHENVRMPAFRYWDHYAAQTFIRQDAVNGIEPFATYLQARPDELIPVFQQDEIEIVVVGGSSTRSGAHSWARRSTPRYRHKCDRSIVSVMSGDDADSSSIDSGADQNASYTCEFGAA